MRYTSDNKDITPIFLVINTSSDAMDLINNTSDDLIYHPISEQEQYSDTSFYLSNGSYISISCVSYQDEEKNVKEQLEVIHNFASNIISNLTDLDAECAKIIEDNFWDLV